MKFKLPTEITISRFGILTLVMMLLMAQSTPLGNGGPPGAAGTTVTCTDTSITCAGGNLSLTTTQPNANTWSALQTFATGLANTGSYNQTFNASGACATGGPTAQFCTVGTSTIGLAVGPTSGAWNSGTSGSQQVELCRVASGTASCATQVLGSGGTETFTAPTGYNFGTGTMITGVILSAAAAGCSGSTPQTGGAGTYACTITSSSGAWAYTFSRTYAGTLHPVCMITDDTTAGGARVTAYAGSANAWTGCSGTSTTTDVVEVVVFGNPT